MLDFGLARLTASQTGLTRVGSVMGTPHCTCLPRRIEGRPVDQRSDIFSSASCCMSFWRIGRRAGDSTHVVLHNILNKTRRQSGAGAIRDPELCRDRQKGPREGSEARYQTLADLASDLTRVRTRPESRRGGNDGCYSAAGSQPRCLAQRRQPQIVVHLDAATRHFDEELFQAAIAECENGRCSSE